MKKLLSIAALVLGVASIQAQEARFQLSLTPDIAIHPKTTMIRGLALNVWGENPQHSLNLGFVNGSTGESKGFSWAFIANYTDSYTGVQWAMVNISKKSFVGWQDGFVNYSQGTFTGFQSGFVNVSQEFKGLQWGFINYTEKLNGLQLGLVNVVRSNPWFTDFPNRLATGFPFVNWSF